MRLVSVVWRFLLGWHHMCLRISRVTCLRLSFESRWVLDDMCISICVYLYVYIYTCVSICVYLYVCIYMCISICVYLYVYIYMCVSICLYLYVCIYMSISICVYLYVYIYMCVSICLYLYVCIYMSISTWHIIPTHVVLFYRHVYTALSSHMFATLFLVTLSPLSYVYIYMTHNTHIRTTTLL